jgi:hypothetical protein
MYIDSYTGRAVIRNARIVSNFSAIDALRINGSANTAGRIEFEDCVISMTDAGDAWALRITDSANVVFRNCRFFSEYGQVVRVQNSGVTFENCTFESGTTTSLTNPQMICGEGYVSGSNQDNSLKFINCQVIYNAANVRATGAPTKPIIELGGRNATVQPGRVEVDGLFIRPDSSSILSHQFTTILLHNHVSHKSPSVYRNVTIEELARSPTGAGTLAKFDSSFSASALLIEIVSSSSGVGKVRVENLRVVGVKAPATSLARSVIGLDRANVTGLILDGSASAAGDYSQPLIQARSSDIDGLYFYPTVAIETSSTSFKAEISTIVNDLRYHRQGLSSSISGPLVDLGTHCQLHGSLIYMDVALTTTAPIVQIGNYGKVCGSTVFINGVLTGGALVAAAGSAHCCVVDGSTFCWNNSAANTIAGFINSDRSILMANHFMTMHTTPPTVSLTGTGVVPDGSPVAVADLNVVAANADSTLPTVY